MSSTDEPQIPTEKSAARPNFLGKLWKAQAPSYATVAAAPVAAALIPSPALTPSESAAVAAPDPPANPLEGLEGEALEGDDLKTAPPSKFLSKLWKAQKSSISPLDRNAPALEIPGLTEPVENHLSESDIHHEASVQAPQIAGIGEAGIGEAGIGKAGIGEAGIGEAGVAEEDYIPLEEFQESLKLDEAALIGDPYGASDFNEPIEASESNAAMGTTEFAEHADITDSAAQGPSGQQQEPTPVAIDRKAQRKAGLEAYERMKEEQRRKTERGNTVRAGSSLSLNPGSTSEPGSSVDTGSDNDSAIAGSTNPESLVTRQSFASTVAADPATAPKRERAAGANEFVRKHPLSVVLVIALIGAGIAYYPTENSRSNLNDGAALLANNQPQAAVDKLTRAIASNPRLVAAYVVRADAYSRTGATDLALADCQKAIVLEPGKPEAYEMRAKIVLPLGRFRQVISDLETVSRIRGTLTPAAMATLGQAYMGDGQYSHALTQFSKKLDREPGDSKPMMAKAKCYLAMNLPYKAIENCDAAIAQPGNTYDAYVLRGECEDQLNNGSAALKDFDKAISLDGQRADAFLHRGMYFAHAGDFTKASQDMDTGIKLPGGIPEGRYKHAMVYALQKDRENALEQFRLLEAKPDFKIDNWFYIQRSDVYAQLQDFKMARADLEKALSSNNAYLTACWLRLARCFESEHDYKRAALYAGKVLADEPTNSTALLKHSKYSLLSGNRMTAMDDLYKAIASAPKNPLSYLARGDIYIADKQYSLADNDYQKAAQLAPLNAEIKKKLIVCNQFVKRPKASTPSAPDKPATLSAAALKEIADGNLQTLKQKGYEALKSGRAEYAVAALSRAIYLNPNDGNARRYLAYALLKTGNTEDAAQQYYAWEKIADPDPSASIAFAKSVAAQTDAQTLFEHLAERYRTNAPILLEIARQCAFYHYDSVEGSALDFATKVATSDQQVGINRLRISLESASGRSRGGGGNGGGSLTPGAVSGGKPVTIAN